MIRARRRRRRRTPVRRVLQPWVRCRARGELRHSRWRSAVSGGAAPCRAWRLRLVPLLFAPPRFPERWFRRPGPHYRGLLARRGLRRYRCAPCDRRIEPIAPASAVQRHDSDAQAGPLLHRPQATPPAFAATRAPSALLRGRENRFRPRGRVQAARVHLTEGEDRFASASRIRCTVSPAGTSLAPSPGKFQVNPA